jgi:hypothetical protein
VARNTTGTTARSGAAPRSLSVLQLAEARRWAQEIAADLARVADDAAHAFDRLAITRDKLATTCRPDRAERLRRDAQRARDLADWERRESQRLRDAWRPLVADDQGRSTP